MEGVAVDVNIRSGNWGEEGRGCKYYVGELGQRREGGVNIRLGNWRGGGKGV